jgi:site-specific recombinase XerD
MTPSDLTLRDFSRSLRARNRSPRTIGSYLESARQLADFRPDQDVALLSRRDIEEYLGDVLGRWSASTAATRFRALQQLYRWAVDEEMIDRSPMEGMRPPTIPEKPVPVLGDDTIRALLKACDGKDFAARRDTAIVRLFLEPGGLRLAELAGLAVDDLDLDNDVVLVLGKGNRPRSVPFGAKTGSALTRYMRLRTNHKLTAAPSLWLGMRSPLSANGVAQMIARRADLAGLPHIHPHQLRHTAASRWLAAGGSEGDAMRLFGWRSREMLGRYGAAQADDRAREAARRLALGDLL